MLDLKTNKDALLDVVQADPFRHYFICLSLQRGLSSFSEILVSPCENVLLFIRKTGNIQIASRVMPIIPEAYTWLMEKLSIYNTSDVLCVKEIATQLMAKGLKAQMTLTSTVATCSPEQFVGYELSYRAESLQSNDLAEVAELYKTVFKGFSSLEYMHEKLASKRGRAVVIKADGCIVSVAQTDFESLKHAVVVGVATKPDFQGKGYATACMVNLCRELASEGKTMGLLYENDVVYGRLGFKPIDQLFRLERVK